METGHSAGRSNAGASLAAAAGSRSALPQFGNCRWHRSRWLLLAEYVADERSILRTPEGKPYLPGGPEFSLSHGGDLAVLLISDTPCGVDVECADRAVSERIRERVFQRIFQREEADSERAFSWLWTRKEAVMKLDGRGLGLDPRCFSVLAARTQLSGREIALATQIVRGHFISIAYDLSEKG